MRFDPLHLHEVLLNLLGNAIRYASKAPCPASASSRRATPPRRSSSCTCRTTAPASRPEVRAHLFEPFYTTSSKGTGLGLYLARELCLNNDAKLDYEYRFDAAHDRRGKASGRFVISFAQPA